MHKLEELFQFLGSELFISTSSTEKQDEAFTHLDSIISKLFPNQLTILPLYQNNLEFKSKDYIGTTKPLAQNTTDLILGIITDPLRSNEIITAIWKSLKLRTQTPIASYLLSTISAATNTTDALSNHKKSSKLTDRTDRQSRKDKHHSAELKTGLSTALNSFDQAVKLIKFDYSRQSIQLLYKDLTILVVVNPSSTIMASMTIGYQLLLWTLTHKLTTHLTTRATTSNHSTTTTQPAKQTYLNYHTILQAELLIRVLWPVVDPIVLKLFLCYALNLHSKESTQHTELHTNSLTIAHVLFIFSKFVISHDFARASACSLLGPIAQTSLTSLNSHPFFHDARIGLTIQQNLQQPPDQPIPAFPTSYPPPPPHYQSVPCTTPVSVVYPTNISSPCQPHSQLTSPSCDPLLSPTEIQALIDLCNIFVPPSIQLPSTSPPPPAEPIIVYHPRQQPINDTVPTDNPPQQSPSQNHSAMNTPLSIVTTPVPSWLQLTKAVPVISLCPFHMFINIAKSCNYSQRVRLQSVSVKLMELLISTIFYSHSHPQRNTFVLPLQKISTPPIEPAQITVPQQLQCSTTLQAVNLFQPICTQLNIQVMAKHHLEAETFPVNSLNNRFAKYMLYTQSHPYRPLTFPQIAQSENTTKDESAVPPTQNQPGSFSLVNSLPNLESLLQLDTIIPTIHTSLPNSLSSLFHLYFQTIKPLTHQAVSTMFPENDPATLESKKVPSEHKETKPPPTLPYLFPHFVPPSLLLHTLTQLKNVSLSCQPLHSTSTVHSRMSKLPSSPPTPPSGQSCNHPDDCDFPLPMTEYAQAAMNDGSFDRSLSRSQSRHRPSFSQNCPDHGQAQHHQHHQRQDRSNSRPTHSRRNSTHSQTHEQTPHVPSQCNPSAQQGQPRTVNFRFISGPLFIPEEYQAKLAKSEAKKAKKEHLREGTNLIDSASTTE